MTENVLGLHTFVFADSWQLPVVSKQLPALVEKGVGLFEIPLLRPDELDTEGTRKLAESLGIELVCSLGLPAHMDVLNDSDSVIGFLKKALEVTARTGATALSGVTYGTIGKTSGAPPTQQELDAISRVIEAAARSADELGLRLGIEPCNRYETHLMNRAIDGRRLIERIGADNVFIHLDTYHMNIEENGSRAAFDDAGEFLGYLHVSESHRGVLGTGNVPWSAIMAAARGTGYTGPMTLESFVYVDDDIASGLALWRPVADSPESVVDESIDFLRTVANDAGITLRSHAPLM